MNAVLFDLDSTLYPASTGLQDELDGRIYRFIEETLGLTHGEAQTLRRSYFAKYGTTLRGLQLHHDVDTEAFLRYVHDLDYAAYLNREAELDELLERVAVPKAVFTNSPIEHAQAVLRQLGVERHFVQIFDIRFLEFVPKPDPAGYRRALEVLGVPGAAAVMVEDTAHNLEPARALGMTTVLVAEASAPERAPADYVVPNVLTALRSMIDWLNR